QNNLIYNKTKHGIVLYHIDAALGSTNNKIIHNTIVQASSAGAAIELVSGSTGTLIFNNILYGGSQGSIAISGDSYTGLVSDYNVMLNHFENADNSHVYTLAEW